MVVSYGFVLHRYRESRKNIFAVGKIGSAEFPFGAPFNWATTPAPITAKLCQSVAFGTALRMAVFFFNSDFTLCFQGISAFSVLRHGSAPELRSVPKQFKREQFNQEILWQKY